MKIVISIDDVHPQSGWRILSDPTEKWLRELNERFGAKFTLFVPSNYHKQYPLSKHKTWVNELSNVEFVELACHGHYHMTSDPTRFGEMEFAELRTPAAIIKRLGLLKKEWRECGLEPWRMGWKNPGWICSEESNDKLDTTFKYVSLHYEHNNGLTWTKFNKTVFFGHDGIQETDIKVHNISEKNPEGMIMFTSHIAGDWNKSVWNQENFEQLCSSLEYLTNNYECEFVTLNQCI